MVDRVKPQDVTVTIKFGGGLHTRASEDEIDPREAADGANFLLDLENRELRNRPPFDLIGTVPNAAEIRGGFSLLKADGSVALGIQAGATVYEWDGGTTFTPIGTVNSSAKLRGHWRSHLWALDDKILITDLTLNETVKEWDGTTFQSVAFTNELAVAFGNFYARYLSVTNERAVFSHVKAVSTTTPHMIVGCQRGDYTVITVSNRPSSSLNEQDPFFLLSPDLRPINGMQEAFGTSVLSTEQGRLFNLTGSSAKDFAFDDFYPGSHASGDESIAYVGNDIIYGRKGRIESVRDTNRFGDSEADDLTKQIANEVEDFTGWNIIYNSRLNRAYCFPDDQSEVWALNIAMRGGDVSPWMRWNTQHALAFQPTFVMSMLDPSDGLEYTFMGDADGNFYRLEGSGAGDGGTSNITTEWLTKLHSAPLDAEVYNIEGYIKYRKNVAATVTLNFEYGGQTAFDQAVTITIPALSGIPYFGGDFYFGGDVYFGVKFENRLLRQKFQAAGQASDMQVRVTVDGTTDIRINEIFLRMTAAS
jgi:hypothetical protein